MMLEFSAGSGRYDVVEASSIHLQGFVGSNYIAPLDELAAKHGEYFDKADFVPSYLKPNLVQDKLYGLPLFGESSFLMYRKDLFELYGIAVRKASTRSKPQPRKSRTLEGEIVGITMRGQQGIQGVYIWASYLWGMGGPF